MRNQVQTRASGFGIVKVFTVGVSFLLGLFLLMGLGSLVENVDATDIVAIQHPVSGKLDWYTTQGVKWQGLGKVTTYPKRSIYEFEAPIQFNDGGKGVIHGSIQYDLPLDRENLNELHTRFGSPEAIQKQVMEVVTNKVIYMTGPVMSSRESYAEKRNYLVNYIQDQVDNGIYQTRQGQQRVVDQLSQQEKTVSVAEIVQIDGRPARQEKSVVGEFGIRAFNFAIEQIDYDDTVEAQITDQQKITMSVQTSIADALKAQQQTITVEQQGKAAAAQAKWEQEKINSQIVAEAEGRLKQAQLMNETAEQERQATLKRADGESKARKLMMEADNALEMRLNAQVAIAQANAKAIENIKVPIVPTTVFGSGTGGNSAATLLDLMTIQAAKQVGLDK